MKLTDRTLTGRPADLAAENRELHRLRAQVAAVLNLHALDEDMARYGRHVCKGCATHMTFAWWPCATVEAVERLSA